MKFLFKAVIGLSCMIGVANAEVVAPDAVIKTTVQEVLTIVKSDKEIQSGNQKKVQELVDAKVLPHFDFELMTKSALGLNWRQATPDQRKALTTEFRNMLVGTYTKAFVQYRDQVIQVAPLKLDASAVDAVVSTRIVKPGTQAISVKYYMQKVGDEWKVVDVEIENLRIVFSKRNEFDTKIKQSGVDGLIRELSGMNAGTIKKADAK